MAYRIAGIDVHKKMLAVVVADVAVEGEFQFLRRTVGTSPTQLRSLAEWLLGAAGRRSGDGIDGAVLATGVGSAGAVLATAAPEREGAGAEGGGAASGTGPVESWSRGGGRRISRMPNA